MTDTTIRAAPSGHHPTRIPAIAIRLALPGESTLALGSRRVVPARPMELGYRFVHGDVTEATAAALADSRR
jgi:NAD dependent epimerase/dehydratase family enzyme